MGAGGRLTSPLRPELRPCRYTVAITKDGRYACSAAIDETAILWDLANGSVVGKFTAETRISRLAMANDGMTIVAGEFTGEVHVLQIT